jgi:hypothetical protein
VPLPIEACIECIENHVLVNYASIDGVIAVPYHSRKRSHATAYQLLVVTHPAQKHGLYPRAEVDCDHCRIAIAIKQVEPGNFGSVICRIADQLVAYDLLFPSQDAMDQTKKSTG